MTPSNPSNQNPFILCIMDALGIPHQVAPLEHTHTYAEVTGLQGELNELWAGLGEKAGQEAMTEALAAKQDALTFDTTPTEGSTNPVTSGGIKAALDGKAPNNYVGTMLARTISGVGTTKVYIANPEDRGLVIRFSIEKEGEEELEAEINENNIGNLIRALVSPDATPTADSDNLVTSGGVKAAIDDATKAAFISSMPYIITAMHEKMRVYTRILTNNSGVTMTTNECLDFSTLPPAERVNILWNAPSVDIAPNESFGIRFMRFATGVYVWYDGKFEF